MPAARVIPSTPPGRRRSGFDPGHKLGHCERFGQIIVGSGIQSRNPVFDRIARRQDQDRESSPGGSRGGQHGETITIGQAKIEDGRVIADQLECDAGILRRTGNVDGEADFAEPGLQDTGQALFILDDQKTQREPSCLGWAAASLSHKARQV